MAFTLPQYFPPDFEAPPLKGAPTVTFQPVEADGVAPTDFHVTTIYPEYFHLRKGQWVLPADSRMDCVVVLDTSGSLLVKEIRHLRTGERVACGRRESAEDGIFVHASPFKPPGGTPEKFAFRTRLSRETSFSSDYDQLYELLLHERRHGFILWVLGPAVVFDRDAREAFVSLIERGFVHGMLAGNALAVHDIEAGLFGTALGQEIYSKRHTPYGHYAHLDAINTVRRLGSIPATVRAGLLKDGIMRAILERGLPHVLAGSIRDDGPLPDVITDVCEAQDRMRSLASHATTVIALATQLHAIATGNLIPCYRVLEKGKVRPVYFYSVDMSEFAADKLANRGSLSAHAILTNVQDFVVILERGLIPKA